MGYDGKYSLGSRCGSEAIATALMVFLGEGTMANELLSKTKGHSMGYGWIAFGFGNAFFASLICLSHISAKMNPAFCFGLWLLGELDAGDCFAMSAAEVGGAMIGACLVWLFYLPHFKTIPEPTPLSPRDTLLRSRDAVSMSALRISSYDTRPYATASKGFRDTMKDVRFYLAQPNNMHEAHHMTLVEEALGQHSVRDYEGYLRRHSVQVCDMHSRLKKLERETGNMGMGPFREKIEAPAPICSLPSHEQGFHDADFAPATNKTNGLQGQPFQHEDLDSIEELRAAQVDALYKAAVVADQNAKLSVFCTRPAIRSPIFNWLVELLSTLALVLGVLLMDARGQDLEGQFLLLWGPMEAFFIGLYAVLLIIALGGPTGIAMNPARDFGPRLVHWILPIPGKGSSEWDYSWIPVTAGLLGGVAGAAIYKGINEISLHTLN